MAEHARSTSRCAPKSPPHISTDVNEDWTKVSDLSERRRIQNRLAQRNHRRRKLKQRLQLLEAAASAPLVSSDQSESRIASLQPKAAKQAHSDVEDGYITDASATRTLRQLSPEILPFNQNSSTFEFLDGQNFSGYPSPDINDSTRPLSTSYCHYDYHQDQQVLVYETDPSYYYHGEFDGGCGYPPPFTIHKQPQPATGISNTDSIMTSSWIYSL